MTKDPLNISAGEPVTVEGRPAFAMDRRRFLSLLGAGAAGAVASGMLPGHVRRALAAGGVLKVAAPANPSSMDPMTGGSGQDHPFLYTVFDTLVEWEYESLDPKPGLARAWSFPDPKTLVMDLQEGVKFHDGTDFNAEAVKFNLDRNRGDQRSNIKADLINVEAVEVSGPHQVTIRLKNPDAALPMILSDRAGMMCSPKAVTEKGDAHDRNPVGTGAWSFVAWNDNEKVVVKRNEGYWKKGTPKVDGIEFAIIPELSTGLRSVMAGQNHFVYFLSPQQGLIAKRAPKLTTYTGPTLYCIQIYFNWARKPLDDVRVRQAINHAIDRDAFVKVTMNGIGEKAITNLPSAHWAFDKELAGYYPYDPEKAKALLAEAGYADGLDLHLGGYPDQSSVQRQEFIMEQLRQVGIRVRYSIGTIPEASAAFFGNEKKTDALVSAWTGRPDPSLTFSLMYLPDAYYNGGRGPVPDELVQAIAASRASPDKEARKLAFSKVQKLVLDNALVCPLAFLSALDVAGEKVEGYKPNLLNKPKLYDVSLA